MGRTRFKNVARLVVGYIPDTRPHFARLLGFGNGYFVSTYIRRNYLGGSPIQREYFGAKLPASFSIPAPQVFHLDSYLVCRSTSSEINGSKCLRSDKKNKSVSYQIAGSTLN